MKDYHVVAWNYVDEKGDPIIEIDENMKREEYKARVEGKFVYVSCSLLRAISRDAIDWAFAAGI